MGFAERFLGQPGSSGFTIDMLDAFLSMRQEENVNLDYKLTDAIRDPDKLVRTCAAFANAEGGLLLLGVEEAIDQDEKGQTVRIRPGKVVWGPKSLTRERLESIFVSRIHPRISGLRIHPIRNEQDGVVFLVEVPQSVNPPHQTPDGKYYLRYNFQNLPMEHNQIAALFEKRLRPDLRPGLRAHAIKETVDAISIEVSLRNQGGALAKYPFMILTFEDSQKVLVENESKSFFIDEDLARSGEFRALSYSKEIPLYSKMSRLVGSIVARPNKEGTMVISVTVCAEDMPTRKFLSGISLEYLRKQSAISPDKQLVLAVFCLEEPDEESARKVMRQMDIEWEDLERMLAELPGGDVSPDRGG